MGRIARGWELTQQTWKVVRADRSLAVFPVISGITALAVFIGFVALGAGVGVAANTPWAALPVAIVGFYALIVVSQFCSVALASCAPKALDGQDTSVREGFHAARGRLDVILQWSLVQLVVGALISGLQALLREGVGNLIGSIVGGIANASWSVATFFVVPILALDGLGPRDAFKKSTGVVRERWGEGVTGAASIGAPIALLGFIPGFVLIFGGGSLTHSSPVGGGILIAIGVVFVIVSSVLQATLSTVFRVALYRYATAGEVKAGFTAAQFDGAFRPKRSRGLFGRGRRPAPRPARQDGWPVAPGAIGQTASGRRTAARYSEKARRSAV